MSLENDDQLSVKQKPECRKQSGISYSRDFLLSFSNLDICKKLPSGFNTLVLSELEEASIGSNEWNRSVGGSSLHSSKRGDYGSIPPNRLENSVGHSRGSSGRWEVRSSASSNRDKDLHTDPEAYGQESGRRLTTQPRRVLQQSEHDGLLGSGGYPRPPEYAGHSASRGRGTSHFQLNRGTEPYQPPRPYKDAPFQRHSNDSRNDETFGSSECNSEDKAEEERRRRESFELMRKEHQKAFQEKQKQIPDNKKEIDADVTELSKNTLDCKKIANKNDKADGLSLLSQNESSKSSITQPSMSRPLVPPGFASATVGKNLSSQPSNNSLLSEDSVPIAQDIRLPDATSKRQENGNQLVPIMVPALVANGLEGTLDQNLYKNEKTPFKSSDLEMIKNSDDFGSIGYIGSHRQTTNEFWEQESADIQMKGGTSNDRDPFAHDDSISLLEKLFSSALPKTWGIEPTTTEIHDIKKDETILKPSSSDSSKFASWFLEEDKNLVEDASSKNLLAFIVNNDKSPASLVSNDNAIELVSPCVTIEVEDSKSEIHASLATSLMVDTSEQYHENDKTDLSPTVLTCEDLEQFILADVKDKSSSPQHSTIGPWIVPDENIAPDGKIEKQKINVDDHASKHILSLLQKATKKENEAIPLASPKPDPMFFNKVGINDSSSSQKLGIADEATHYNSETASNLEKTLTLETLFGAAFMSELKSADAPLSVQRLAEGRSIESAVQSPAILPSQLRRAGSDLISSNSGNNQYENSMHIDKPFHQNQKANAHYHLGPELNSLNTLTGGSILGSTRFEEGALDFHLPEQDSLIIGRTSSQLPHLNSQVRPLLTELDDFANRNQQMKFIGPDIIHHNSHQTFPSNVSPHNSFSHAGAPRVDPAMHHLMLQQMSIPGNFSPQFPIQGFPRGSPLPHPVAHRPGYVPEMNNAHNIALHHQLPNYGGFGMGMPGPIVGGGGSSHPEAFQMLVDMELRANAKNLRPTPAGHIPGVYGPKFDMNFRYR